MAAPVNARVGSTAGTDDGPRISGVMLRVLADAMLRRGFEPGAVLATARRRFADCEPIEVRLPLHDFRTSFQQAIAATGDPALGLHAGLSAHEAAFDLMAPLVAHLPSLRHALHEAARFSALLLEGAHLHHSECAGTAELRIELPRAHDDSDRTLAEFAVAGMMRLLSAFGCTAADVHAVRFEHRRPAYYREYTACFHGRERFSQPSCGIELSSAALDRPNMHDNPALQALMRAQAEARLTRIGRPQSSVDRLRTYLRNQPIGRVPEMATAARELGTSVRSLRRRLSERGSSYRELVQQVQCEHACTLVRNPRLTLQGVAHQLGFADMAAFHRAFKRWTGVTANQYRQAH